LEAPLTWAERARIVVQVGSAMVAGALLLVAWVQARYGSPDLQNIAHLITAVAACIVAAPIFLEALSGLFRRDTESATGQLVALAIFAAMMMGSFGVAALIAVIMNLGHFFEERSILGAQAAIEGLKKLHTGRASVLMPDGEREVDAQRLNPGDVIVVRPGEVIAADGAVVQGDSAVDQSSITGESVPEDVQQGDPVFAGSVNLTKLLHVRVARSGPRTALGRVVGMLQQAERSKTRAMKLMEQYAGYYVPLILIVAAVVLFVTRDMTRAVTVLVVACPGAFILAGPTAMVAALAAASRLGVLIKNSRFLESLGDVDTVVLDKTGTVTLGRLQVVQQCPCAGFSQQQLLATALTCAHGSRHPVSRAIVEAARSAGINGQVTASELEELHGKGVRAREGDISALLGRRRWLLEEGFSLPDDPAHQGPIVWLGRRSGTADNRAQAVGCLLLADVPRPEARQAIVELRSLGVQRTVLLTGDRHEVAREIAAQLAVDEVISEVLPQQKLEIVERECESKTVMMVGDGVNDALALARGDVGVAIGAAGSDVALRSADVALMTDNLRRLPTMIQLARRTRRTVHQNVLVGLGMSVGFVWLASIGTFGPIVGGLLHFAGELFVICNSARLLSFAPVEQDRDNPSERVGHAGRVRERDSGTNRPGSSAAPLVTR
jgi:heavy metal translocating P-type ATPase